MSVADHRDARGRRALQRADDQRHPDAETDTSGRAIASCWRRLATRVAERGGRARRAGRRPRRGSRRNRTRRRDDDDGRHRHHVARQPRTKRSSDLIEKRLPGFGELFRSLSYQEIGSAAMLSRAAAGIARRTAIFMLPGSEHAVRLGMTRLIVPELGHIVRELRRR